MLNVFQVKSFDENGVSQGHLHLRGHVSHARRENRDFTQVIPQTAVRRDANGARSDTFAPVRVPSANGRPDSGLRR